jgi:hypothetical protein
MTDDAAFKGLALSLPEAEEQDHRGHPSFRVREKIFATLWPGEHRAVLKLRSEDRTDLVKSRPETFSLNAWSKQGWTDIHLAHITPRECQELLEGAWRVVAPKKIISVYDKQKFA